MKLNLNHVAVACVVGAVITVCTALAVHADDQQLAAASGLALLLANTAGTIAGRTRKAD